MKTLSSNIYAFFVISQQHRLGTSKKAESSVMQLMMKMVYGGSAVVRCWLWQCEVSQQAQ